MRSRTAAFVDNLADSQARSFYRLTRLAPRRDSLRNRPAHEGHDPAYLNYTMGKLMIWKLRDDGSASRGGRQAWRQFHDQFLTYGGPPIPMVRRQMMGNAGGSLF